MKAVAYCSNCGTQYVTLRKENAACVKCGTRLTAMQSPDPQGIDQGDRFGIPYLVVRWLPGPKPAPKPGDVITHPIRSLNGEQVPGPFRVAAETTAETTREDILAPIEGERYFRLVAE